MAKTSIILTGKIGAIFTASVLAVGFLSPVLTVSAQSAAATVDMTARNLTRSGAYDWSGSALAGPSDRLEFSIQIKSGSVPLYNLRAAVDLVGEFRYIPNSGRINGALLGDGISSYYGLGFGNLTAGDTKNITFQVEVIRNYFDNNSIILTPYVNIRADNLSGTVQDRAQIIVSNQVQGTTINYSNDYYPIIYIEKRGANVSRGDLNYGYTTYASPGEIVEFAIKVKSSSNTLGTISGVWVSDRLPPEMVYISNSTFIDGLPATNGIASGGIEIGALARGQTKTVKFRARVLPINLANDESVSLANFAAVRSAGAKTLAETDALIIVSKDKYSSPAAATAPSHTSPAGNGDAEGEVLGAATVKTGPSGTIVIISVLSLVISFIAYRKFRGDRILRPFGFWNDWRLKRNLRRLAKEK